MGRLGVTSLPFQRHPAAHSYPRRPTRRAPPPLRPPAFDEFAVGPAVRGFADALEQRGGPKV